MKDYIEQQQIEKVYLQRTIDFINKELENVTKEAASYRNALIASRKDMSDNTAPFSNDFAKLTELVQYLSEINSQSVAYANIVKYVQRYKRLIRTPYFGRFDLLEDGFKNKEEIYIGLATAMDQTTRDVHVSA